MVASSDFHAARFLDFHFRTHGDFLAGRIFVAPPAARVAVVDMVYVISSIVFVALPSLLCFCAPQISTGSQRQALWLGFACCIASLAFLGFLSIIYDFHDCFHPSREHPYFTSGRLMLGALIPFLLLFVYGLDRATSRIKNSWFQPLLLAAMILFMLDF